MEGDAVKNSPIPRELPWFASSLTIPKHPHEHNYIAII